MEQESDRQFRAEQDGMELIVEFPQNPNHESHSIQEEIKQLLFHVLQEHFTKNPLT